MVSHEISFGGGPTPLNLDLENDELFRSFQRWVQKDLDFKGNGWVGTVEDKTWVINFKQVACIRIVSKEDRRSMGFGR